MRTLLGLFSPLHPWPKAGTQPIPLLALAAGLALISGCTKQVERTMVEPAAFRTLDSKSPYLKAHLRSGSVYILHDWRVETATAQVVGSGRLLSPDRVATDSGAFSFPTDSVALFETNVLKTSGATKALTVMAGVTAAVAGLCLADPKTCFGSCPTFYFADGNDTTLQAEGFSASIAPALEATDLDALDRARPQGRHFTLRMTNEALETHVVRYAHVLAAPRQEGGRVFVTPDGTFRQSGPPVAPVRCDAREGDCTAPISARDGLERVSLADSTDLAARETIDLEFPAAPPGELGVVLTSRQSLMTTYILYQQLAWLGSRASGALARLGASQPATSPGRPTIGTTLGRIEVLVPGVDGSWEVAGASGETGPLASDTKMIPIPRPPEGTPVRIRLRLTQGLWRIDQAGLVALGPPVIPTRLLPATVRQDGRPDATALALLTDTVRTLVTMPGDRYEISYRLPAAPEGLELFLEVRGYYLEWMRREWMAEENPLRAAGLMLDPAGALRALAADYKRAEPGMEAMFWRSRYAKP